MSSLDHTSSIDHTLTRHFSRYPQLPGLVLLVMAGAVVIVGIVLQNYYMVAALPVVLLLIRYPVELSLGIFAFLIPFDSVLAIGQTGYTVNWLWGGAAGAVLFTYGLVRGRLKTPPRAALWWGLFTFWAAATLFWALDPSQVLQRLPSAVCLFLFYLVAVSFRIHPRELRIVVLLAIAGGVLAAGYTLREFAQGTGWFSRASLIVNGQKANPNELADTLLLPLSLALGGFLSPKPRLRAAACL